VLGILSEGGSATDIDAFDLVTVSARLQDPNRCIQLAALAELLMAGREALPAREAVAACLNDPRHDENARSLAVQVLAQLGEPAVSALTGALGEAQPLTVRVAAAGALARNGPAAEPAIASLCQCLQSDDEMLRWHAGFALSRIGPAAVPALKRQLQFSRGLPLLAVINALEWIGKAAAAAREDIQKLSSAGGPSLRSACAAALVKISGNPSLGLPMLHALVEEGDASTRKMSAERIGNLGPIAGDSMPVIQRCLEDESPEVRAAAALAMVKIQAAPAVTVPALTKLLSDPDPEVRAHAAMGLAACGPAAGQALPLLKSMRETDLPRLAAFASGAVESIEASYRH